jgi:hypothetical protein
MLSFADPERIREREEELVTRHREYVADHPELHSVLCEFTSAVLTRKPDDIFDFAATWWAKHLPEGHELPALTSLSTPGIAFPSPAIPFQDSPLTSSELTPGGGLVTPGTGGATPSPLIVGGATPSPLIV